jgi:hypothetical protein
MSYEQKAGNSEPEVIPVAWAHLITSRPQLSWFIRSSSFLSFFLPL